MAPQELLRCYPEGSTCRGRWWKRARSAISPEHSRRARRPSVVPEQASIRYWCPGLRRQYGIRSEEHTSELQSPCNLVCRLLLEKKKKNSKTRNNMLLH